MPLVTLRLGVGEQLRQGLDGNDELAEIGRAGGGHLAHSPDIEVLQEVPEELKVRTDTSGEASLRGHLKAEGDEQTGSQSYIPPNPKDDKAPPRSISCGAPKRTRLTRRIPRRRSRTRVALSE